MALSMHRLCACGVERAQVAMPYNVLCESNMPDTWLICNKYSFTFRMCILRGASCGWEFRTATKQNKHILWLMQWNTYKTWTAILKKIVYIHTLYMYWSSSDCNKYNSGNVHKSIVCTCKTMTQCHLQGYTNHVSLHAQQRHSQTITKLSNQLLVT